MSCFDLKLIPNELLDLKRWGYAKLSTGADGKPRKVPCSEMGVPIDHGLFCLKLTDLLEKTDKYKFQYYAVSLGTKTALEQGHSGLLVLDYDHVLNDLGEFHDKTIAKEIDEFKKLGYVERSVSGTGYHVFCKCPKDFEIPRKAEGGERYQMKRKLSDKGDPDGSDGTQNYLEIFEFNKYILFTGKNEGQSCIVPDDSPILKKVLAREFKEEKDKLAGVKRGRPSSPVPSTKATTGVDVKFVSGTLTHDSDQIALNKCRMIIKALEGTDYEDESDAGGQASEKAMSICNLIVNTAKGNINADELDYIWRKSPCFQANYGEGKSHEWNESKAVATYQSALNQTHNKQTVGRPKKPDLSELPYDNFSTQLGIKKYVIENLSHLLMYDAGGKQWYVKDKDGFCFIQSSDNGYAKVSDYLDKEIDQIKDEKLYEIAKHYCTKGNIQSAIDLAKESLAGLPTDVAYVFDGGKTLHITQDDNGLLHIDVRDSPDGLKTSLRVQGEYWEGTLAECPKDFQDFVNKYGTPQFVNGLLRVSSLALPCRPIKICFQFTSDESNTGKSTWNLLMWGSWGKQCFIDIEARELMTGNSTGRRTALLTAIQFPMVVVKEAEGKIAEGVYKEVIDTSSTFSGNFCGRDRIEVQRNGTFIIESNGLIRATNTNAYAERTYPIEFTKKFQKDERLQAKIKTPEWQKYARGIIINAFREYVKEFNAGRGIEEQLDAICPEIAGKRKTLLMSQDFKQKIISEVAELTKSDNDMATWVDVWQHVYDVVRGARVEIEEWGMTKSNPINPEQAPKGVVRDFNKTLELMGFKVERVHMTDGRHWVVYRISLHQY